jgi:hypothetical protein
MRSTPRSRCSPASRHPRRIAAGGTQVSGASAHVDAKNSGWSYAKIKVHGLPEDFTVDNGR